jgi:hypothetical protein
VVKGVMTETAASRRRGASGGTSRVPQLKESREAARPYAAFLYVWGLQWIVAAIVEFIGQWRDVSLYQAVVLWTAVAVTIVLGARRSAAAAVARDGIAWLVPLMIGIGGLIVLQRVGAVTWFFWPVLQGFALSFGFALASPRLGLPLFWLSLWMFAVTACAAFYYLGYSSLLVGGFGGLSLLAVGWMISVWNRRRTMQ